MLLAMHLKYLVAILITTSLQCGAGATEIELSPKSQSTFENLKLIIEKCEHLEYSSFHIMTFPIESTGFNPALAERVVTFLQKDKLLAITTEKVESNAYVRQNQKTTLAEYISLLDHQMRSSYRYTPSKFREKVYFLFSFQLAKDFALYSYWSRISGQWCTSRDILVVIEENGRNWNFHPESNARSLFVVNATSLYRVCQHCVPFTVNFDEYLYDIQKTNENTCPEHKIQVFKRHIIMYITRINQPFITKEFIRDLKYKPDWKTFPLPPSLFLLQRITNSLNTTGSACSGMLTNCGDRPDRAVHIYDMMTIPPDLNFRLDILDQGDRAQYQFLVMKINTSNSWKLLSSPLGWFVLLLTILTGFSLICFLTVISNRKSKDFSVFADVILRSALGQDRGSLNGSYHLVLRILVMFWVFVSLVISETYKGNIFKGLVVSKDEGYYPKSFKELDDLNLTISSSNNYETRLMFDTIISFGYNAELYTNIRDKLSLNQDSVMSINETASKLEEGGVLLDLSDTTDTILDALRVISSERDYYTSDEKITLIAFTVVQELPVTKEILSAYFSFIESGIMSFLKNGQINFARRFSKLQFQKVFGRQKTNGNHGENFQGHQALNTDNVNSVFFVLFTGWGLSFLRLLYEFTRVKFLESENFVHVIE